MTHRLLVQLHEVVLALAGGLRVELLVGAAVRQEVLKGLARGQRGFAQLGCRRPQPSVPNAEDLLQQSSFAIAAIQGDL